MAIRGRRNPAYRAEEFNQPDEDEPQVPIPEAYSTPEGVAAEAINAVVWDDDCINFKLILFQEGCRVDFHGWYRISGAGLTASPVYCIDIYARHAGQVISIQSIPFPEDPRLNIPAVNERIVERCNFFFAKCIVPNALTWKEFERLMTAPSGKINRSETIDRLLLEMRATRDTAFSSAGTRYIKIQPDMGQPYLIELDLSKQAIAMEGKVPSLEMGTIADIVLKDGQGNAGKRLRVQGSAENIESLARRLKETKDPAEQRRIRALMRQMGHKGGARAIQAKQAPPTA